MADALHQGEALHHPLRGGRRPHIGLRDLAQQLKLALPLVDHDLFRDLLPAPALHRHRHGQGRHRGIPVGDLNLPLQILRHQMLFLRQRVAFGHDEVVLIGPDGIRDELLALQVAEIVVLELILIPDDAQVAVVLRHPVYRVHGVGLVVVHLERVQPLQLPDKLHKRLGDVAGDGHRHLELVGIFPGDPVEILHLLHMRQDLFRVEQELLPLLGGHHAPGGPVEDLNPHLILQLPDRLAEKRLIQIEILRRPGDGLRTLHLHGVLQVL